MKQKDIVLVLVMVFIGAALSFVISGAIFGSPDRSQQNAEVVDLITPEFPEPPDKYYNAQSINPTIHVSKPQTPTTQDEADEETQTQETDDNNDNPATGDDQSTND